MTKEKKSEGNYFRGKNSGANYVKNADGSVTVAPALLHPFEETQVRRQALTELKLSTLRFIVKDLEALLHIERKAWSALAEDIGIDLKDCSLSIIDGRIVRKPNPPPEPEGEKDA